MPIVKNRVDKYPFLSERLWDPIHWVSQRGKQEKHFGNYAHKYNCQHGKKIASIGAGNGIFELAISCFAPGIHWCLQEIDTSRLYQFDQVLRYFTELKGSPIEGTYEHVVGAPTSTNLPRNTFDRILMINVFHELENPEPIVADIKKCLKPHAKLVIMERMGEKPGQIHGDCKFPKLIEAAFLKRMKSFGFANMSIEMGEIVSILKTYTFQTEQLA